MNTQLKKTYTILGKPIPWKRAGLNKTRFFDQQQHERLAFGLYLAQQHGNDRMFEGPLLVEVVFYMPIPKTKQYRSQSEHHSKKPDIDNLCKFCCDCITSTNVIWKDDALIAQLQASKVYDQEPKTIITIRELV